MAKGIKIIGIESNSVAAELDLAVGDRVWTINGKRVRDALDFKFLTSGEEDLTLEVVKANGDEWQKDAIAKDVHLKAGINAYAGRTSRMRRWRNRRDWRINPLMNCCSF